jgi:tetratricopeptide (TPR) repeat protein
VGEPGIAGPETLEPERTGQSAPEPERTTEPAPAPERTAEPAPARTTGPAAAPDAADPESALSTYSLRLSPETLRELADDLDELRTLRDRLTEKLSRADENASRARLLGLRSFVSRILGDLGMAHADGKLALVHAEATGELRPIAVAKARMAIVLHWRGDLTQADRLFAEADSPELPGRLRAAIHEYAGRCCYDQGRYIEACDHFWQALDLQPVDDPDLVARVGLALDAVLGKVAADGWGPYARSRDEVLPVHRPPVSKRNESFRRWGYVDAGGAVVVPPSYADAQPFSNGAAWVRRPDEPAWELIDEAGTVLIPASAGYRVVRPFTDGVAWVRRDGVVSWSAIDRSNRVVVPPGYDDVRPFRRGTAAVRRGGWGAVDKAGRVVVPTRYDGFATTLADGRSLDGFSDEGLAVVVVAGSGQGVVDRTGRVIVTPTHEAVVIHPLAFLVSDGTGRWGALDRHGEPLVEAVHPNRTELLDEIDRVVSDTRPLL